MAISFPRDILIDFPGWSTDFDLMYRQEQSRTAGGRTIVKDLGTALWAATYASRTMRANELDQWKAILNSLDGGAQTFKGYPLSRVYPIAYPNGSWPTGAGFDGGTCEINSIDGNNKAISIKGFPAAFKLSVGDYLRIGTGKLYQVMEAATASGAGVTPTFEVRPQLAPGTAVDNSVSVLRPFCPMAIVPGSISTSSDLRTGRGSVSFQAMEAR
jgi:hypothetical protein